jgi:hypothetical protein
MSRKWGFLSVFVLTTLVAATSVYAQVESSLHARPRITQGIDEASRAILEGNTHPEARPSNDRGPVASGFVMEHCVNGNILGPNPWHIRHLDAHHHDQPHGPSLRLIHNTARSQMGVVPLASFALPEFGQRRD